MRIIKKVIFIATTVLVFSLVSFIGMTRAANPPTGCTGPGADSGWASPTEYIGYYACHVSPDDCPGPVSGWSRSTPVDMGLNTHGCVGGCSPCALGPSCCAVGKIVWDKLPDATCSISASPNSLMLGTPTNISVSWAMTNATNPALNGTAVALSGSQIFAGVSSSTTYDLTGTDLSGNPITCSAQVAAISPPIGGLVPCGRLADNPDTAWDETKSCGICHVVPLIYNVIYYLLSLAGIISVLMLALTVLASNFAFVDASQLTTLKRGLGKVLMGFLIVFVAWLIVNLVMNIFGFIDPLGDGSWKKFDCNF